MVSERRIFHDTAVVECSEGRRDIGSANDDTGIQVGDSDIGGELIVAGVDKDGVAKFQIVGFKDGANTGFGRRQSEAVIRITTRNRGINIVHGRAVVDVVIRDRRNDAKDGVRLIANGGSHHRSDA